MGTEKRSLFNDEYSREWRFSHLRAYSRQNDESKWRQLLYIWISVPTSGFSFFEKIRMKPDLARSTMRPVLEYWPFHFANSVMGENRRQSSSCLGPSRDNCPFRFQRPHSLATSNVRALWVIVGRRFFAFLADTGKKRMNSAALFEWQTSRNIVGATTLGENKETFSRNPILLRLSSSISYI